MNYLSVCSGIEAATVAWHPLGWQAVAYSEIERFPSEVLAHHYPTTPNLGDMTNFKEWNLGANVDLLVGGTPCQSFSVAGLRKGLDDPRGNLMLTYLAIADRFKPKWIVWENVPGVLSSNRGKDFGVFLGALGELGYGFAYRVLDAQYFGVAQRRKRVFVVGYLGDWRPAAAVLFERHSLQGHPAPSREKRESVASYTPSSIGGYSEGVGTLRAHGGDISSTLDTTFGTKQGLENQHVNSGCPMFVPATYDMKQHHNPQTSSTVQLTTKNCSFVRGDTPLVQPIPLNSMNCFRSPDADASTGCGIGEAGEAMFTITKANSHAVAQPISFSGQMSNPQTDVDMTQTLQAKNPMAVAVGTDLYNGAITGDVAVPMTNRADGTGTGPTVMQAMAVRRLTPVECERLQGFPDSYTDIKSKDKPTPDGPRYKALGNSMAVPVMAWIGQRIRQVEQLSERND